LSILSIIFGVFFMSHLASFICFLVVPSFIKFLPLLINVLFFSLLLVFLSLFTSKNTFINSYFSQIMFLTPFMITLTSKFYLSFSFRFVKAFESGMFNFMLNTFTSNVVLSLGSFSLRQANFNSLFLRFFSLFFLLLFLV
jgi:hypothetical protein